MQMRDCLGKGNGASQSSCFTWLLLETRCWVRSLQLFLHSAVAPKTFTFNISEMLLHLYHLPEVLDVYRWWRSPINWRYFSLHVLGMCSAKKKEVNNGEERPFFVPPSPATRNTLIICSQASWRWEKGINPTGCFSLLPVHLSLQQLVERKR